MNDPVDQHTADPSPADRPGAVPEAPRRLSPALLATLITVPVLVIAGFIGYAALNFSAGERAEVPVDSYAVDAAAASQCAAFIAVLPERLGDYGGRSIDGATVRWTEAEADADPVVLRCGVQRPRELAPTSALQVINPVQWFMTDSIEGTGQAYISVDHRPYVAVWVPAGAGNAPITDVSALIEEHLERAPLDFGN